MEWLTEPPNMPGYYWAWDMRDEKLVIVHAFYMGINHKFLTLVVDWDNRDDSEFSHWMGPIIPPEWPK